MNETLESGEEAVIFVTSGYDHTIKFWQVQRGSCERTIQCQSDTQVNCLELTSDGKLLAAGCYQNIRVYDAKSGNSNPLICCNGVQKNVLSVGFEQDGRWMYSAGEDGFIRVWDFRSRSRGLQCAKYFRIDNCINAAVLHPNQAVLYIGSQQGKVYYWDLTANYHEEIGNVEDCSIQDLSIDVTGSNLSAVTNKGDLYIWPLKNSINEETQIIAVAKKIQAHKKYALKCKYSPDGKYLATTSADGSAKIWKTSDSSLYSSLSATPNQRWVWDCAFSSDSKHLMTSSSDNLARVWDLDTCKVRREYEGHQKAVTCLAFKDRLTSL